MEQMRECVARAIAPFLEGGREFDKMPVNRLQLREWARRAMCGFNDATQDDAYEAADALQPEIDRRVEEEKAKLLERLRTPIWDALASAYATGATDVHNSWIAGTNGGEPDFGEAASDYAACVDPLTAFQQENSDAN